MATVRASRAEWVQRVAAWRASGESAERHAADKGYAPGTLKWWARQVGPSGGPRFVRVVPAADKGPTPATGDSGLWVEVGAARVRISRGFDATLLREVMAALGGAR